MNLLVVGGGGREHAIIKKLKENPSVETIYALPGNGGIAADAVCVPEIGTKDIEAIVAFAKAHSIDFAVVAPDDPLALGCVDPVSYTHLDVYKRQALPTIVEKALFKLLHLSIAGFAQIRYNRYDLSIWYYLSYEHKI